jgi:ABC-type transporter Mla MlaB component
MTSFSSGQEELDDPLLQVELAESPCGYLARLKGDLVAETVGVLWGVEPLLRNEARICLDLSGVTAVDPAGLKAALTLVQALHAFGGRLTLGD